METKAHEKICLNCMWLFNYDSRDRCRGCEQDHENFQYVIKIGEEGTVIDAKK